MSERLAHLPRPSGRWAPGDKEAVLTAIRRGEIAAHTACARFGLTLAELNAWTARFMRHGRRGLAVLKLQEARP